MANSGEDSLNAPHYNPDYNPTYINDIIIFNIL